MATVRIRREKAVAHP